MLNHAKKAKYKIMLAKMALDNPTNQQDNLIYENICDPQILLGLVYTYHC
jgi:hypothetical protein